jgi:hypothetical protein
MAYGDRKSERVEFGRGIDVHIRASMGILKLTTEKSRKEANE